MQKTSVKDAKIKTDISKGYIQRMQKDATKDAKIFLVNLVFIIFYVQRMQRMQNI